MSTRREAVYFTRICTAVIYIGRDRNFIPHGVYINRSAHYAVYPRSSVSYRTAMSIQFLAILSVYPPVIWEVLEAVYRLPVDVVER